MVTTLTTKKSGIFFSPQARWKPRHIFQIYRIFHKSKVKAVFWDDSGFFNREIKKWSWKKTWSHHISNKETFLGIRHQTARFKCHGPVKPEVLLCRLSSKFKLEWQKILTFFHLKTLENFLWSITNQCNVSRFFLPLERLQWAINLWRHWRIKRPIYGSSGRVIQT